MLRLRPPLPPTHVWLKSACNFTVGPPCMWFLCSMVLHPWIQSTWELCETMLLLSCFSRVRLCATPWTAAHQAPLSLGFSGQEHWSGLPFPSPRHESEKWKWSRSVMSNSATPWAAAYQAPPSMGFSRQEDWSGGPLPSPVWDYSVYLLRKGSAFQWAHAFV